MCRMDADGGTMDNMNPTETLARRITLSRARYLNSRGTDRHALAAWRYASAEFEILTGHAHPLGRRS